MDKDCTIPQYLVVSYCDDINGFEKRLNELAQKGYEVSHYASIGHNGHETYTAIMVRRASRLEVLVKDGKVVQ